MTKRITTSVLLALLWVTSAFAHEGKTHVMGTVSSIDAKQIVVTDRDGKTVSIAVTNDTKYEQGETPATASALKAGTRVVVDVAGKPESLTATEIHIAPVGGEADHMHDGPKDDHHKH